MYLIFIRTSSFEVEEGCYDEYIGDDDGYSHYGNDGGLCERLEGGEWALCHADVAARRRASARTHHLGRHGWSLHNMLIESHRHHEHYDLRLIVALHVC